MPGLSRDKPTILLVSDNYLIKKDIHCLFENHYNEISSEEDTDITLLAKKHQPDLILFSPETFQANKAIETIRYLKFDHPSILIILLIESAPVDFIIEAFRHGVRDCFTHPLDLQQLGLRVHQLLKERGRGFEKRENLTSSDKEDIAAYRFSGDPQLDSNIRKVLKFIEGNYQRKIKLNDLAKEACMSKFYLCDRFKEVTGMTSMEYLNHLRVVKAKALLQEADNSITQITFQVGFEKLASFEKYFKHICGMTPSEYRLIHLLKNERQARHFGIQKASIYPERNLELPLSTIRNPKNRMKVIKKIVRC